jgi:SAM-dependent methyltransferase
MENSYLDMQKKEYNEQAQAWSVENKDPVVGNYHLHNTFSDYDDYLFPKIDTSEMIALEYGCGPARNLIKYHNEFKRIDGVDIGEKNIKNATLNLEEAGIKGNNLYVNSGDNIPTDSDIYDIVFSVICLQHICVHDIRMSIMKEVYRVLKADGHFCFQMGYGLGKPGSVSYFDNVIDAPGTNGTMDTRVEDANYLVDDLMDIGFKDIKYKISKTGPGDTHENWIWVQAQK